jgi:hypothetical protein
VATEASIAAAWRIASNEVIAGRGSRLPEVARFLSELVSLSSSAPVPG